MDIAATVGPERLREIMTDVVTLAAAVVVRYGGAVDKFAGDGIMAVFGVPVALEDHALRACLAALGIQQDVTGLAAEVRGRDGIDLQLRVGLNSGQVIAGDIGSTTLDACQSKPTWRSSGWRPRRPTAQPTRTSEIATATWRKPLTSKDISPGPMRCPDTLRR